MSGRPAVAVLGAGRAGCSFYDSLLKRGYAVPVLWTRSAATAAAARAEGFPAVAGALPDPGGCGLALLAVSDGAVAPLARSLAGALPAGATAAHVSGALDLSPLEPLRAAGCATGSLHPLASLARRGTDLGGYAAAVEASDERARQALEQVAADLGLTLVRPTGSRARYHAAACVAGNYPQVLLEAGARMLAACGLSADEARSALAPLLESAARNARALGGAGGLTGPVARGDVEVVRAHLTTFAPGEEGLEALYRAAGALAAELAREAGAPRADEIAELLAGRHGGGPRR